MRPNGRSETESLYFNYPKFDAPDAATRSAENSTAPVAIVGAGPIGMTAALALAKEGIRSVVFDNKDTFNDGSRAICIARPSYYILEQLGALAPFLEKSLGWTTGRSYFRGKKILEFKMPDGPNQKFRPMYNLQQQYIEQFLWQAAQANDLIEMRWQSEVTGIEDHAQCSVITVKDPYGEYSFESDWVLACDGARSNIRSMRGHRLKGENYAGRYVIADVQMDYEHPTIRLALFEPACRPDATVLIHKQPDNIWRIDYQLKDNENADDALREETVRASVASVLKELAYTGAWELEWWSIYSANTLAMDDYRDGRVFFVGDSAHIVPIFGVRGLNNGLADAANIGWKLGWVINKKAGKALLNTYSDERRAATFDVFKNATKSARFMTPNTHGFKLMRDATLSLALNNPFAGQLANPRQMEAFSYKESLATLPEDPEFIGGPGVGQLMLDVKIKEGFLSDKLGKGFTALCFDAHLAQQIEDICPNDYLLNIVLLPQQSAILETFAANASSVYLLRPDMHIAGRWHKASAADVISGYQSVTFQDGVSL